MIKVFCDGEFKPKVAYSDNGDACIDLPYNGKEEIFILKDTIYRLPTKCYVEIPKWQVGIILERSGLGYKNGIGIHGRAIDSNYRGQIVVILDKDCEQFADYTKDVVVHGTLDALTIKPGDRIAQMLITNCYPDFEFVDSLDKLSSTERGNKGFGSSGITTK